MSADKIKHYEENNEIMKDMEYTEPDITCPNCCVQACDLYANIPDHFYEGMIWYCSEQCYEEHTRNEG